MKEDYKDVSDILGKNVGSFLVLAKRWLVDWNFDPQKILHMLLGLKQEEAVGLMNGTHKIVVSDLPRNGVSVNFEPIMQSDFISVPSMEKINKYVREKSIPVSLTSSDILTTGKKVRFRIYFLNKRCSYQKCRDFIKSRGEYSPNLLGMVIAEMEIFSKLPKRMTIIGLDYVDNLSGTSKSKRIPFMSIDEEGKVKRSYMDRGSVVYSKNPSCILSISE